MRILEKILWFGLLGVIAVRPWMMGFETAEQVKLLQWAALGLIGLWSALRLCAGQRLDKWLALSCLLLLTAFLTSRFSRGVRGDVFFEGQSLVFCMALMAGVSLAGERRHRQLLGVLVATGVLLALHALWQAAVVFPALADFPWDRLEVEGSLEKLPVHTVEFATQVIARRRAYGPFPLPGLLAAALVMLLPLSVAVLRPWASTPLRRILTAAVLGMQATALLLTQSLGGIVAAYTSVFWVLVLRQSRLRFKWMVFCAAVLTIWPLLVLRPELVDLKHTRNPIAQRWRYWSSTVEMIRAHPVRGVGAANYAHHYPEYRQPLATPTRFAHNAALQVWAEWGVLGLAGLAILFARSFSIAARGAWGYQAAVTAFWCMAFIDIVWSIPQLSCIWWALMGILSDRNYKQK